MRGYDRTEMYHNEDWDRYEEDGEEQDEDGEEEYEEEQEDPKPTKEELEYLEIRQRLKEAARKKIKKENGVSFSSSQERKKKLPYDNFGSFFGPSQPVIAPRVIQESKSLLENQHLAARISSSTTGTKKTPASTNSERRPGVSIPPPRVNFETQAKLKAQKLKNNRDYSFLLSEDSELPAPKKDLSPRKVTAPKFDARSAQVQPKSRQSMSGHSKVYSNGHQERKPVPANRQLPSSTNRQIQSYTNRQIQSKSAHHQVASGSRQQPNMPSAGSRKQTGSQNTGSGPGRPTGQKVLPSKMPAAAKVPVSNKVSSFTADRKPYPVDTKKPVAGMQKPPLSRLPSSGQKQHFVQRREVGREVREPERAKINSKVSATSSKPQVWISPPSANMKGKQPTESNLPRNIVSRAPAQVDRPKKRHSGPFDDDEEEDPSAIIRKMFRYDPRKYNGVDEDDSDMEANFDDILKEERRSARIAHEEDERERLLIEEEERREKLRKEAKKRKLNQR